MNNTTEEKNTTNKSAMQELAAYCLENRGYMCILRRAERYCAIINYMDFKTRTTPLTIGEISTLARCIENTRISYMEHASPGLPHRVISLYRNILKKKPLPVLQKLTEYKKKWQASQREASHKISREKVK